MRSECYRCGEKMRKEDVEARIFSVGYKPICAEGPQWREIELCEGCQHDLRAEFYKRGLTYRG